MILNKVNQHFIGLFIQLGDTHFSVPLPSSVIHPDRNVEFFSELVEVRAGVKATAEAARPATVNRERILDILEGDQVDRKLCGREDSLK